MTDSWPRSEWRLQKERRGRCSFTEVSLKSLFVFSSESVDLKCQLSDPVPRPLTRLRDVRRPPPPPANSCGFYGIPGE